ncbi:hypothetical protein GOP47_0003022 [Adiantum capillus-veneris]|uniref:BZIP domain-containing protein n=1 Tax=Adiantum capillus-veneris TaxID=13818 RepID=A0A9D4VBF3_ADICA|nr:hypothetical protein GOP47_0003022 [Adiantum capillus-veneris]
MVMQTMLSSAPNGSSASDLARQPSIYSLTLEEIQNAINEPGKTFGSMNMDEFLKNLWTAEESQAMVAAMASSTENTNLAQQPSLQRLNSLSLPPALSRKTVEDVWKEIQRQSPADLMDGQRQQPQQQKRQVTLGEMTLEDFLVRAGAFREDADANSQLANGGNTTCLYSAGMPSASVVSNNLPPAMDPLTSSSLPTEWMNFPSHHQHQQMLQQAEAAAAAVKRGLAPPPLMPPSGNSLYDGLVDNSGLGQEPLAGTLALSPAISEYGMHSRKRYTSEVVIEKTVERRQKRMIKNRESAARSRARKQAYTVELEAEVTKLKEENARLKQQQALESRVPETRHSQQMEIRVLRRVQSCSKSMHIEVSEGDPKLRLNILQIVVGIVYNSQSLKAWCTFKIS